MNKKQKKVLIRVIVASVLLILCAVLPTTGYVRFATFMVPYLVMPLPDLPAEPPAL